MDWIPKGRQATKNIPLNQLPLIFWILKKQYFQLFIHSFLFFYLSVSDSSNRIWHCLTLLCWVPCQILLIFFFTIFFYTVIWFISWICFLIFIHQLLSPVLFVAVLFIIISTTLSICVDVTWYGALSSWFCYFSWLIAPFATFAFLTSTDRSRILSTWRVSVLDVFVVGIVDLINGFGGADAIDLISSKDQDQKDDNSNNNFVESKSLFFECLFGRRNIFFLLEGTTLKRFLISALGW